MTHSEEQNELAEAIPEKDQMADLLDKQLLKDSQRAKRRHGQPGKSWMDKIEPSKNVTEIKKLLKGFKNRFEQAEEKNQYSLKMMIKIIVWGKKEWKVEEKWI